MDPADEIEVRLVTAWALRFDGYEWLQGQERRAATGPVARAHERILDAIYRGVVDDEGPVLARHFKVAQS